VCIFFQQRIQTLNLLLKMNTNNEDGWEDMIEEAIISAVIASNNLLLQMIQTAATAEDVEDADNRIDHRTLPRRARRQFKHGEALACLMRDYLGPSPLFGKEFDMMFRISRT
jgi:outer membrane cobalamin receptor